MWPIMRATARPAVRRVALVVVAAVPVGVAHDGLPAHLVEGDLHRRMPVRRRDGDARRHRLRIGRQPIPEPACPPSSRRDRQQALDTQMVDQQLLRPHHVGHGHERETSSPYSLPVAGIDAAGPAAPLAAPDDVRADDEVLVGVEALARADHRLPPARLVFARVVAGGVGVAGQGVQDEDGVGALVVQAPYVS